MKKTSHSLANSGLLVGKAHVNTDLLRLGRQSGVRGIGRDPLAVATEHLTEQRGFRGGERRRASSQNLQTFMAISMKDIPLVIQSYHPSSINERPAVQRASFSIFYDAKSNRVIVYPLLVYSKEFSETQTPMKHGKKLSFDDKHGGTIDPQVRESILKQLGPFVKTAFLRAAAINEHGLSDSNPISRQVSQDLSKQPSFHQESFALLKEGTRLSTTVTEFVTGKEDPLAAFARECLKRDQQQ